MTRRISLITILFGILLLASPSWACMVYRDVVQDLAGNAITGVTVTVNNGGTLTAATIYSEKTCTTTTANPLTNNADGTFSFYAKQGRYDLALSKSGVTFSTATDLLFWDANDLPSAYNTLTQGTALTLPLGAGTFTGSQRITYNVTSGGTLWANAIVGEQKNNAPVNTTTFPSGLTGYGTMLNTGNQTFGVFGRADLPVATGVATNEFNSFNVSTGDATAIYPPDRSIGTAQTLPIALTVAAGGSFKSAIGIHLAKEGSAPQQFRTGIYMSPDAIADYGLFIDATATQSAGTLGALIKTSASVIPLQVQTVGTVVPLNAVFTVVANGTTVFAIKQNGSILFPDGTSQSTASVGGGGGITSIDTLSAAAQTLATGTAGTDFNISSVTATHTFNLPTASAVNRGALASADWTTFNGKAPSTRLISTSAPLGGGGDMSADRTLTCTTCVTAVTASGNLSSSGGTTPALTMTATPSFTSATLTANTNQLVLGTTNTTTITMAALTLSRTLTLPDANSVSVVPFTCSGTDKLSGLSAGGVLTCTADQTGSGGTGITSLNGLIAVSQTFAVGTSGTDVNISSVTSTHTFNFPDASATARGLITTGTQNIKGFKTFLDGVTIATADLNALDITGWTGNGTGIIALAPAGLARARTSGWAAPSLDTNDYTQTVWHVAHGNPSGVSGTCSGCIGVAATAPATELDTVHFSRYDKTPSGANTATLTADLFANPSSGNTSQSAGNFVAINYRTNASNVVGNVQVATPQTTAATTSVTVASTAQAGSANATITQKSMGGYFSTASGVATPATYSRNDWVTGTNTTNAALGVMIANASTTQSGTAGLVITGVDPLTPSGKPFKTGIMIEDATTTGMTISTVSSGIVGLRLVNEQSGTGIGANKIQFVRENDGVSNQIQAQITSDITTAGSFGEGYLAFAVRTGDTTPTERLRILNTGQLTTSAYYGGSGNRVLCVDNSGNIFKGATSSSC